LAVSAASDQLGDDHNLGKIWCLVAMRSRKSIPDWGNFLL